MGKHLISETIINVRNVDENGDAVGTGGAGTQYAEGAIDATITGTVIMWEDAGDTMRAVSAANPLPVTAEIELAEVELGATTLAALETITVAGVTAPLASGDNNIGNVDLASAIPAGANLIGSVAAALSSSAIMDGTTAMTPKFAIIDAATSGDNTLVSAHATKKLRVLACFMVAAGTVNARFEGGAGGTALTGQMNLVANSGFVLPFNPVGWFETAANTLLNLELSGAVSVDGSLVYVEV